MQRRNKFLNEWTQGVFVCLTLLLASVSAAPQLLAASPITISKAKPITFSSPFLPHPAIISSPHPTIHSAPAILPSTNHIFHSSPTIIHSSPQIISSPPVLSSSPPLPLGPSLPYKYQYSVADDESGTAFSADEASDGNGGKQGSYSVVLPDGRTQHVKYTSDDING